MNKYRVKNIFCAVVTVTFIFSKLVSQFSTQDVKSPKVVVNIQDIKRVADVQPVVQYVGFGGLVNDYKLTNIKISGAGAEVKVPAGFEEEQGEMNKITCGSKDGALVALGLGFDEQLYKYNVDTMNPDPWEKMETKDDKGNVIAGLIDVSCGSDGTLCVLNNKGAVYKYDWAKKVFIELAKGAGNENLIVDYISVGHVNNIWAVDVDKSDIYQYTAKGWEIKAKGVGIYVSAGIDNTVVAINTAYDLYKWENNKWVEFPGTKLTKVSVASKDNIWGTYLNEGVLEVWQCKAGKWEKVKGADGKEAVGFDDIAVNAAGTVFATNLDGTDVYHLGEAGVKITIVPSKVPGKPAVVKAEKVVKEPSKRATAKKQGKIAKPKKGTKTVRGAKKPAKPAKRATKKVAKKTAKKAVKKAAKKVSQKKAATKKVAPKTAVKKTTAKVGA